VATASQIRQDTMGREYGSRIADYKKVVEEMRTVARLYGRQA
jgi:hypothetical protein